MFQQAIQGARQRVWIASPYFVPDDGVLSALHLATLRGVDVRLLIPERSDNRIVDAAAETFLAALIESGIAVYRYQGGFLHSKHFLAYLILVQRRHRERRQSIPAPQLRSHRHRPLPALNGQMAEMFERDLARSQRVTTEDLAQRSFARRLLSRIALLFAPVL